MSTRSKSFAERIADILIEDGLLLPNQLEEAVGLQQKEGGRLLKILTEKHFVTDQDMAFSMGRCLNTAPINLVKVRVPEEIMSLVPREMAKKNKLIPIARLNGKLFVAMADPTNVLAVDDVKRRVGLEVIPMIATERSWPMRSAECTGAGAQHERSAQAGLRRRCQRCRRADRGQRSSEEIDLDRLTSDRKTRR